MISFDLGGGGWGGHRLVVMIPTPMVRAVFPNGLNFAFCAQYMGPDPWSVEERGHAAPSTSGIRQRDVPLSRVERCMLLLIADNVVLTF